LFTILPPLPQLSSSLSIIVIIHHHHHRPQSSPQLSSSGAQDVESDDVWFRPRRPAAGFRDKPLHTSELSRTREEGKPDLECVFPGDEIKK
jgi:hypothetical protein